MVSGWSFVDSLNNVTKINRVANKLRLAHGVLIYAEIKIDVYQGMYKNKVKKDRNFHTLLSCEQGIPEQENSK